MSRRKETEPESESVTWKDYPPSHSWYWFLGGPFIPPEEIPAGTADPTLYGVQMKSKKRVQYVSDLFKQATAGLEKEIARYLDIHTRGMAALDARTRERWHQQVHAGEAQGKADPVSESLGLCVAHIIGYKARILAYQELIATLSGGQLEFFS